MNNSGEPSDYPLAETEATMMLASGLIEAQADRGLTQRDVARELGYKSSVVVSHMALGRVPIPIDRAPEIARLLKLDPSRFLVAVLQQRYPDIDFIGLFSAAPPSISKGEVASELETIARRSLDELDTGTIQVLREVVAAVAPASRWLAVAEVPVLEAIRRRYPQIAQRGLSSHAQQLLDSCLNGILDPRGSL